MFLQILPPDNTLTAESIFENQLLFVILGLTIGVFAILRITKYLSKLKFEKTSNKPSYTS
ncbi:hypothetical protein [Polaribacter aquimarinus]|uniref:Uncharacterized protein n=1 Tax=Polaribacter aquimarinus TaxID=2100726 RepID=A0A2U2JBI1_9FLAO|nr:hypothetical protein [Polaribacter aquimarinus]PWG05665.1 hypothetical protein DIS07_04265 [Polaribacter aquimarinus]